MIISVDAMNHAYELIRNGFNWAYSPQGGMFWHKVCISIREIADAENIVLVGPDLIQDEPWPPEPGTCDDIKNHLHCGFVWASSPQGGNYWGNVIIQLKNVKALEVPDISMMINSFDDYDRAMRGI